MQNVIQTVMAAEAEARQMVEAARKEAERTVADARTQSQAMMERARQESRLEAEKILAAAEEEGMCAKAESLAQAANDIKANVRMEETVRQEAVDAAVRCLCGFR